MCSGPPPPFCCFFDAAGLFNWYWCFYLQQSRELVSSESGFFLKSSFIFILVALNETANFPKAERATGTDAALATDGLLPALPMGSRAEYDGNIFLANVYQHSGTFFFLKTLCISPSVLQWSVAFGQIWWECVHRRDVALLKGHFILDHHSNILTRS